VRSTNTRVSRYVPARAIHPFGGVSSVPVAAATPRVVRGRPSSTSSHLAVPIRQRSSPANSCRTPARPLSHAVISTASAGTMSICAAFPRHSGDKQSADHQEAGSDCQYAEGEDWSTDGKGTYPSGVPIGGRCGGGCDHDVLLGDVEGLYVRCRRSSVVGRSGDVRRSLEDSLVVQLALRSLRCSPPPTGHASADRLKGPGRAEAGLPRRLIRRWW
jgi:hypothetical protein